MMPNPALGILFHAIGGLAAASFYAPLKKVHSWAWESTWLAMGVTAWLIAPCGVAFLTTEGLIDVLSRSPPRAWFLCLGFGLLWGLGNLTFGLSVRYLGMALGFSVALGFCMAFGTLVPPIAQGEIGSVVSTLSGQVVIVGVLVGLIGIAFCGWAGLSKDAELSQGNSDEIEGEFSAWKGILVAAFSGILSACFAFGLAAGAPIAELSLSAGTRPLFSNNAVLVVILLGGFCSNAVWCVILGFRNGTFRDYVSGPLNQRLMNVGLAMVSGVLWYGQFFFYGMGSTNLGESFEFSSWSIHMAFIIVLSNLWGILFHEWRGTSRRTKRRVWIGTLALIFSTVIIGLGNFLSA